MGEKQNKNFIKKAFDKGRYALKTVFVWFQRAFFKRNSFAGVEKIESPARLLRDNFFRKKAAVFSLVFFAFPLFICLYRADVCTS